jgi:succinoglycan biosynthesis protein ExoU
MQAAVAILIPAHRAAATIGRAVESALAQTAPVEVVVVDDASPDATADVARSAAAGDTRLRVLRHPANCGPATARNTAISASGAPWLLPLDADDVMRPDRVAQLLALAASEAWDFIADDLLKLDESAPDAVPTPMRGIAGPEPTPLDLAQFIEGNLARSGPGRDELGFLKPLMRRRFLARHGLRYSDGMRLGEDYDLYARALLNGARFCLTPPLGYVATVRAGSLSGRHTTRDLRRMLDVDRALAADPRLGARARAALDLHRMQTHKEWAWRRLIDAVKARDAVEALRCFVGPMPVGTSLLAQLSAEARARLGAGPRRPTEP